ncbi:hypothetical protein CN481_09525 [Bacillus sp. AFS006103]|jgi:hypothetical protein|nr:hypothetical protein CN481_09525 [Bacillus sp. AFS006103]
MNIVNQLTGFGKSISKAKSILKNVAKESISRKKMLSFTNLLFIKCGNSNKVIKIEIIRIKILLNKNGLLLF